MTGSALVIGGGIAGLLAARALSEHFTTVRILDRDYLGVDGERSGVPQAPHLHVLLQRGRQAIEELLPGTDALLAARGAPEIDWAADTAWRGRFGWFPRYDSGVRTRSCSRTLLEATIRKQVLALPNVFVSERQTARELVREPGRNRLRAVRTKAGAYEGDFFVDATGRGGTLDLEMNRPGGARTVDAQVGYSSCFLEIRPGGLEGFKQVYLQMRPPLSARGAVLIPVEDRKHLLTVIGSGKERPGITYEDFLRFARSLEGGIIGKILEQAEPISNVSAYRRTQGVWRIPSRLRQLPDNYLSLGDSACAFNPVYGQGMTVAALQALRLRDLLRWRQRVSMSDLSVLLRLPWFMATSEDLRLTGVRVEGIAPGQRWLMRAFSRASDAILRRAVRDPEVHRSFLRVLHLLHGPAPLLRTVVSRTYS